ncbi:hypothetical protein D3C87_1005890 [compost metagenome]
MPYAASFSGFGATRYSLAKPPIVLISVTPGTVRSCGLISQSWISRRSVAV